MIRAPIQLSATGTLVAAVSGRAIRVHTFALSFSGNVNAKFQSAVGPTDLTGLFYGAAGVVVTPATLPLLPGGPQGLFESIRGEALQLNLSAGVAVGGYLVYELVP